MDRPKKVDRLCVDYRIDFVSFSPFHSTHDAVLATHTRLRHTTAHPPPSSRAPSARLRVARTRREDGCLASSRALIACAVPPRSGVAFARGAVPQGRGGIARTSPRELSAIAREHVSRATTEASGGNRMSPGGSDAEHEDRSRARDALACAERIERSS